MPETPMGEKWYQELPMAVQDAIDAGDAHVAIDYMVAKHQPITDDFLQWANQHLKVTPPYGMTIKFVRYLNRVRVVVEPVKK